MKQLLLLFALMVTAAHAAPDPEEKTIDPLTISVYSPSFGFCRQGQPVTAIVTMSNSLAQVTGTVEAFIGERRTASISAQSFSVGNGRFRFFLYPIPFDNTPGQLTVRVYNKDGRLLASDWMPLNVPESRHWIATIGSGDNRFGRDIMSSIGAAVMPVRSTSVLPDHWHGYRMFDAVIWDGQHPPDLTEAQQAALSEWVIAGGHLLLAVKDGDISLTSPIPKFVPDIPRLPSGFLSGDGGNQFLSPLGFSSRAGGLFSELPLGLGSVMVFRKDLEGLSDLRPEQALPILGLPADLTTAMGEGIDLHEHGYEEATGALQAELAAAAGYESISFMPILFMMILYIAFVSVLDPLLLRKFRMMPRTWLTYPAAICLFSVVSFLAFYRGRLGSDMRQELCFQDVAPDGRGRTSIVTCVRKPSRKDFSFEVPGSHAIKPLSSEVMSYYRYSYGYDDETDRERRTRIIEAMRQDGVKVVAVPGHMGSFKFFTEEWPMTSGSLPFQCDFAVDSKGLRGTFTKSGLVPDSFSGFVFFRNNSYNLDTSRMAVMKQRREVYNEARAFRYHYDGRRRSSSSRDMKKGLESWTSESLASMIINSMMYYQGSIAETWHNDDVIFKHSRQPNEAILYAFFEEQSSTASPPFRRIRCIRQIVKVKIEGS